MSSNYTDEWADSEDGSKEVDVPPIDVDIEGHPLLLKSSNVGHKACQDVVVRKKMAL